MRDALQALRNDIIQLQPECEWVALPVTLRETARFHHQFIFDSILNVLIPSESILEDVDTIQLRIRNYLCALWGAFQNSSLDYTHYPHLPANLACVRLAHWIRQEEEAVCQILMPTVTQVIGGCYHDVILDSEENQLFDSSRFMINTCGDALIDVASVFKVTSQDTHHLFPLLGPAWRMNLCQLTFDLNSQERELIRHIAGETSRVYYDTLKNQHETPSVGAALRELAWFLYRSSKMKKGTDASADLSECVGEILRFYQIWCALPIQTQRDLQSIKALDTTFTLGSYLLRLFLIIHPNDENKLELECPALTQAAEHIVQMNPEIMNTRRENYSEEIHLWMKKKPSWFEYVYSVIPCAHLISENLSHFLESSSHHFSHNPFKIPLPKEFGDMPLNQQKGDIDFKKLEDDLREALQKRELIMGAQDEQYIRRRKFLSMVMGCVTADQIGNILIEEIIQNKNFNMIYLLDAISLLPTKNWHLFGNAELLLPLCTRQPNHFYQELIDALHTLPTACWRPFFDMILMCYTITGITMSFVFNGLSDHDCTQLIKILEDVLWSGKENQNGIFWTGDSIAYLLKSRAFMLNVQPVLVEDDLILNQLRKPIQKQLELPAQLAHFLQFFVKEASFSSLGFAFYFLDKITPKFKEIYFYFESMRAVLDKLPLDSRFFLLDALGNDHLSKHLNHSHKLSSILKLIPSNKRRDLFESIEQDQLKSFFSTQDSLHRFFDVIEKQERFSYVEMLREFFLIPSLCKTRKQLYGWLRCLPSSDWKSFLNLLGEAVILQFFKNHGALRRFLSYGFHELIDRQFFILALSPQLPKLFDSAYKLMDEMDGLPACEDTLLRAMLPVLPTYLISLLDTARLDERFAGRVPDWKIIRLNDLLEKALPILFSQKQLIDLWNRAQAQTASSADTIFEEIENIAKSQSQHQQNDFQVAMTKFKALARFVLEGSHTTFREVLCEYYGISFFSKLFAYCEKHFPAALPIPHSAPAHRPHLLDPYFFRLQASRHVRIAQRNALGFYTRNRNM